MRLLPVPWLELTLLLPLLGAVRVAFIKDGARAARWCAAMMTAALLASLGAAAALLEDLAGPMLPVLTLVHLLAILGTAKARATPRLCARLLLSASLHNAAAACSSAPALLALLALGALLPAWELRGRGGPSRAFLFYMVPFLALLLAAWRFPWAAGPLLAAVLLRGGIAPLHGWRASLLKNAGLGAAALFALPLIEAPAALRLLLPSAPEGMLGAAGAACLATAVYGGGMAVVQREARGFFAYLATSQAAMVLFAVMSRTPGALTAALCLWASAALALAGLGFSLAALEARFGSLPLGEYHGRYRQVPGLAVCFLLSGLASVGFPGTVGFLPMELLISGSFDRGLWVAAALAAALMLNGIAILRAYFALFTGARVEASISLRATSAERAGVAFVALAVLLGGWLSPAFVAARHRAVDALLERRADAALRHPNVIHISSR